MPPMGYLSMLGLVPMVFRINMGAGHGEASGRYDALHEEAFRFAFLVNQIGTG